MYILILISAAGLLPHKQDYRGPRAKADCELVAHTLADMSHGTVTAQCVRATRDGDL